MALFSYRALNENGKKIKGVIPAENEREAHLLLSQRKFFILSLERLSEKKTRTSFNKKELLSFTRETAKLLSAGLPLYEAILSLEEKYSHSHLHPFLLDLGEKLNAGLSFSEILKNHPKNFDLLYCAMVSNAEKTGSLDQTLAELARLIERREKLKGKFLSSLLYPAFLLGFSLIVIFVLFFYILPSLFELFEGRSLHPLTQFILLCSHFALSHRWAIFSCMIFLLFLGVLGFVSKKIKEKLFFFFLRLPLVKSLVLQMGFVRYFRSLSALLQGGVPLLDALQLSRDGMKHSLLDEQMKEAEKRVAEGWLFSAHLEKSSLVPKWACRMVGIAEKTGDLENMLRHIADIYEEELEKSLGQISTFLQPLLLLILGIIVGFVVLSVLIPLTDVSSFLSV
jgi:general secretion pathway protein F